MGNKDGIINIIYYANDAVLIADSEDDLLRRLPQFLLSCHKHNFNIPISKTRL